MALKNNAKVRFEVMNQTFGSLIANNLDLETAKGIIGAQVEEFEKETNHKINYEVNGASGKLVLLDLSKDFVRTRMQNEDNQVLRAKLQGVPMDVKLWKRDDFEFSNEDIVSALRALANEVEAMPVELITLKHEDVRSHIAELTSDSDESETNDTEHEDSDEIESCY